MKELAKQQKAIEYLLHNITKTKEIFDEKFAIRRFLNENFKAKSYTDPIIKEFSLKYLEGFEMQNKGSSMVYYKTEAND